MKKNTTAAYNRQFRILLLVGGLLVVLVILVEGALFYSIRTRQFTQAVDTLQPAPEVVHEQALSGVLARYVQKESIRKQFLTKVPLVLEPSK